MVSLKDYAKKVNCSYENIRQKVDKYAEELDGHISTIKKTRYLDDYAVSFLDDLRKKSGSAEVYNSDTTFEIERLEEEVRKLTQEREMLINRIVALQATNSSLLEEKTLMIADSAKVEMLEALNRSNEERIQELKKEKEEAKDELNLYERTIFGFYRKKKPTN